jgi:hypothetical protein
MQPKVAEVAIVKSVSGCDVVPSNGIEWAIEKGIVAMRKDDKGRTWIAEGGRAAAEMRLASQVWRAMVEEESGEGGESEEVMQEVRAVE